MDWGQGEYEHTAARLEPAAERAVAALGLTGGERVLDVGCRTGNAALAAARAGAVVLGIDPAPRLIEVARTRAAEAGLDAAFALGDATALDASDDAFDAVVSVFGVIFADAQQASRELLRVVSPGGRIVVTTWSTRGPTARMSELVRDALGRPATPPTWSDPDVLRSLFTGHDVELVEEELPANAASPEAYVEEFAVHHPMWLAMEQPLREAGRYDETIAAVTRLFAEANEDPSAFRTTSTYFVATITVRS